MAYLVQASRGIPGTAVGTCRWALLLFFGSACLSSGLAESAENEVTLCERGVARLPIVSRGMEEPVAELRRYLRRIADAEFDVAEPRPDAAAIHVGLVSDFPRCGVDRPEELGVEGFALRSDGRSLFLVGNSSRGVRHAVTTFLRRLGCRWYFPGEDWEIVPRSDTIRGEWNERSAPDFATQRRIWYGFGAFPSSRRDLEAWERHNRMGGPIDVDIGHTWHGLKPDEEFAEHPEWFALVDGERRPTKPCYSHPEVLRRAIRTAIAQAERGKPMVSMTPPDGLGYCECERCLRALAGGEHSRSHGTRFAGRPDGQLVNVTSETLFSFVNRVAAAVAEHHPETLIGCYAYSAYSHPPSFPLHPNVYLQTTTAFRRTPISLPEQIAAFGRKTKRLGIREYYSVYQWDWDYPSPGKVAPNELAKDLRFYHRNGITAVNAEASNNWAARGLGYYVAAQLMWDVRTDVRVLVRDFYQSAFGPAARPMQRYYARWYGPDVAVLEGEESGGHDDATGARLSREDGTFDLDALRGAYRDLDEAARSVPADSAYRRRVDLLRMYAHYLALRYRLHQAERSGDPARILAAVRQETVFGGRLTDTNMIHSRPLIGKAFTRRFARHQQLLADVVEAEVSGEGWRRVGRPPSAAELEELWAEDMTELDVK